MNFLLSSNAHFSHSSFLDRKEPFTWLKKRENIQNGFPLYASYRSINEFNCELTLLK